MRDSLVARSKRPSAIFFSWGKRNAIFEPSGDSRGWRTFGELKKSSTGSGASPARALAPNAKANSTQRAKEGSKIIAALACWPHTAAQASGRGPWFFKREDKHIRISLPVDFRPAAARR